MSASIPPGGGLPRPRRLCGLHDPADGTPAVRSYNPDGTVEYEEHYRAGVAHDPADGTPAVRSYNPDGTVAYEGHYRAGVRV